MALGRVTDRGEHVCCRTGRPLQGTRGVEVSWGGHILEKRSEARGSHDMKSRRGLPGRSNG